MTTNRYQVARQVINETQERLSIVNRLIDDGDDDLSRRALGDAVALLAESVHGLDELDKARAEELKEIAARKAANGCDDDIVAPSVVTAEEWNHLGERFEIVDPRRRRVVFARVQSLLESEAVVLTQLHTPKDCSRVAEIRAAVASQPGASVPQ